MKRFFYQCVLGMACFILIPIIFTLLIQGSGKNIKEKKEDLYSTETGGEIFDEDILPGIIANEISMDTDFEAMKAQAVIARTNCLRAIETGGDFPETLTKGEMIRMWGQQNFSEYYAQLESCVSATRGVAMMYNGSYIQADFHAASAGYTRDASEIYGTEDYPYLKSVDCRMDIVSEDFLKVMFYSPQEFIEKGSQFFSEETKNAAAELTAEDVAARFMEAGRDSAGYVTEITIDGAAHSGEEVRLAYEWNSSAFSVKPIDGELRVTTKGCGHGLGESLFGANALAAEGYSYKEILKYFYSEIQFVTQYN